MGRATVSSVVKWTVDVSKWAAKLRQGKSRSTTPQNVLVYPNQNCEA